MVLKLGATHNTYHLAYTARMTLAQQVSALRNPHNASESRETQKLMLLTLSGAVATLWLKPADEENSESTYVADGLELLLTAEVGDEEMAWQPPEGGH